MHTSSTGWGCSTRHGSAATSRLRIARTLVREPDAGNPPVRFAERRVKTEHGGDPVALADESASHGAHQLPPKPPRHSATLHFRQSKKRILGIVGPGKGNRRKR